MAGFVTYDGKFDPIVDAQEERGASGFSEYSGTYIDNDGASKSSGKKSSLLRRVVGDTAVSAVKGAIGLTEVPVGIADLVTGGLSGKVLEDIGYRPKRAKEILDDMYSPEQKAANRSLQEAEGFFGTAGAALQNPSTIAHTVVESAPLLLPGAAVARGVGAAGKIAPVVAGGIGEGVVGAGLAAEQMRQNSEDGLLSGRQAAASLASGAGTAAFGIAGGKIAQSAIGKKLGMADVDTALAMSPAQRAAAGGIDAGIAKRIAGGAASEGILEELPQSMWEQSAQNYGEGKDLGEGVAEAGATGMLAGGVMGGGFNALQGRQRKDEKPVGDTKDAPLALPAPIYTGTPGDQTLAANVERANQVDAAQANADQVYAERAAFEQQRAPEKLPVTGPLSSAVNVGIDSGATSITSPANPRFDVPAEPRGSFAQQAELARLIDEERADVVDRRELAQLVSQERGDQTRRIAEASQRRQALEDSLADADQRVAGAAAQESEAARLRLLDSVLAETGESGNPARQFGNALRRAGYRNADFTEREQQTIRRFTDARAALNSPEANTAPAAPNELDPAALGIRERAGTQQAQVSAPKDKTAEVVDLVSQGWKLAVGRRLVSPKGKMRNLNSAELAAAKDAMAKTKGGETNASDPAGQIMVTKTDKQLKNLSGPGHSKDIRQAASAEISRRAAKLSESNASAAKIEPMATQAPQANDAQTVATAGIAGEKLTKEWTAFSDDSGSLGIPRAEMPQIKAEHRGAMTQFMKARGVTHQQETVAADALRPTQSEFSPSKVKKALGFEGGDRSILVSSDGYVLDGHHQWMAKREKGEAIDIIRFDAPIADLVALANEFPSSSNAAGVTSGNQNPIKKQGQSTDSVSQQKTDAAPEPKQDKAPASKPKARNKIDPEKDSLFVAIAKAGGMDTDELLSNGIDSNDITVLTAARVSKKTGALGKKRRMPISFGFAMPLHKKGGASIDGMRENLQQYGYFQEGSTERDFLDLFNQELRGDPVYTARAIELRREQDQEAFDKMMQEEQDRIDAELAAQEIAESETGFDGFSEAGQDIYADFAEFAFGENGKQDDNAIRAGMRALGFTEDEINDELAKNSQAQRESEEIAAGGSQEGGAGGDGNGAQDAQARERGVEEGFNLASQTNEQAAEQFAQQQAGQDAEPTKAQADRERDAVPFSLGMQSQPKAQGVQAGLFAADGRASVTATGESKAEAASAAVDRAKSVNPEAADDVMAITPTDKARAHGQEKRIADFGEKIGGARKDISAPTGPRAKVEKETDERPAWMRKIRVMQITATPGRINQQNVGKWQIMEEAGGMRGAVRALTSSRFDTEAEAMAAVPHVVVSKRHRVYSYKDRQGNVLFGVFRNITDRKRGLVRGGFASHAEAMEYLAQNPVAVIEHKFGYPERPWLDRIERIGANRLDGDVSTAMFQETFGFRAGEFGNWNMGGDGQAALNHAYEALLDLADTIGVPPKAISLDGQLAIAFGARGRGGKGSAAAHYEPDTMVINLTKIKGAGSLAHEWWHAVDDYFAKNSGRRQSNSVVSGGYIPGTSQTRPELIEAIKNVVDKMMYAETSRTTDADMIRDRAKKRIDEARNTIDYHNRDLRSMMTDGLYNRGKKTASAEQLVRWDAFVDRLRAGDMGEMVYIENPSKMRGAMGFQTGTVLRDMNALYKSVTGRSFLRQDGQSTGRKLHWVVDSIRDNQQRVGTKEDTTETVKGRSSYFIEAKKIDNDHTSDYWSMPEEMGARAFESYIFDKIKEKGGRSDYLVHGVENRFYSALDMYPYPEGQEREAINLAFDNLFAVIEAKETDRGIALQEPSAVYTAEQRTRRDEYTQDLFGQDLSGASQPGLGAGRQQPAAGVRNVVAAGVVPGEYATVAEPRKTGEIKSAFAQVGSAGQAAHVLAGMRKLPQEHFAVLVLDKDNKPISVLRLFAGATSQASVYPEVVAKAVYETPGAASIWFAHNHPSGKAEPSNADAVLTAVLSKPFGTGTGIEVAGHVVIAQTRYVEMDSEGYRVGLDTAIPAGARTNAIPVTERIFRKVGTMGAAIASPALAKGEVSRVAGGKTGVVFVNAQNEPVGFLPLSSERMQKLRDYEDQSGAKLLFGAAARSNASSAFVHFDDGVKSTDAIRAAENIYRALDGNGIKVLDAFYRDDVMGNGVVSMAERSTLGASPGRNFESRADRSAIDTAMRRMDRFVSEFERGTMKDSDTQSLGDTPTVLQFLGAENLQMQIDGATVRKVLAGKHKYYVTADMLRQIPAHLYDPLAVFNSPSASGEEGKIVVTELSDNVTGRPVIVAVHMSKRAGRHFVNDIASVYEASAATQQKKLSSEAIEYVRNKESLEQATTGKLDISLLSVVQSAQDLGKTVATEADVVKSYGTRYSMASGASGTGRSLNAHQKHTLNVVQKTADKFRAEYAGAAALDIRVVYSRDEISVRYRPSPYAEGVYHDREGIIYLVAANLPTRQRSWQVLMHEVVGHYGLANMMGDKFAGLQETVLKMATAGQALDHDPQPGEKNYETVEAVRRLYPEASDSEVAQEVLARMAETMPDVGWFRMAISRIGQWLKNAAKVFGLAAEPTMADIRRLVELAGYHVRSGENLERAPTGQDVAFASQRAESRAAVIDRAGSFIDDARTVGRKIAGRDAGPGATTVFPDLDTDQQAFLGKIGGGKTKAADAISAAFDRAGLKIRQGMVDRYAALKELDEKAVGKDFIDTAITDSSWVLAKMSSAGSGALNAMMNVGRIAFDIKQKVITLQGDPDGGLISVFKKLGPPAELERFFGWVAANRAEKLMAEGREHLFTADEIAAGKRMNLGKTNDGKARPALYAQVFAEFNKFRDDVIAIAEQTGVLSAEERAMWKDEFYVPFYRVMDEEKAKGPGGSKGLSRQEAYKKLKGGKQNLNDLMENTLMNFHHLLSASLKNQAAVQAIRNAEKAGIARKVPESRRDTATSTFVLESGNRVFYEIDDPLVFESITSLSDPGLNNMAVRVMSAFKRVFTNMTTVTPQFVIANTFRDLLQAAATSPTSKNVAKNAADGIKSYRDEKTRAEMLAAGGAFSFGHISGMDTDEIRASLRKNVAGANLISDPSMVPEILRQGWRKWNDMIDTSENITRAATYVQNVEQMGKLRAAFEARDIMDFSQHGAWPMIRFMIRVVPFLNARLQGLDKLYRSGAKPMLLTAMGKGTATDKQAAARFASVSGALVLASLALYMANADDDEYQKLEEWHKDTYWFFRIGNNAFFLPKPFEVGAIATMAERIAQQFMDDKATGKLFKDRMWEMLMQTFAFNPTPQLFQPMIDVYSNKDAFTGRDIETMGMERLSKGLRARDTTTAAAQAVSAASRVFGDEMPIAVSPVQADHLIRGYFGTVGAQAAGMIDTIWRTASGEEAPSKALSEIQPIKRFYRDLDIPVAHSRYSTLFYDGMREANRVYADVIELQKLGRIDDAQELSREKGGLLAMRQSMNRDQRQLSDINTRIQDVRRSDRDGDQKRQEIDRLTVMKNLITERVGKQVESVRADG